MSETKPAMKGFKELLLDNESFLMNRILAFAKKVHYTRYTSTLEAAWRISIQGLTRSLIENLENPEQAIGPSTPNTANALTDFAKEEARLHRKRGVSIGMFLGLFKYYRQTYMDLCKEFALPEMVPQYTSYILNSFDTIEVAFCSEWCNTGDQDLIPELQKTNRFLTNEKNAYLTVFESLVDAVFMINFDREIINLNHAASQILEGKLATPGKSYYAAAIEGTLDDDERPKINEVLPWIPTEMLENEGESRFKVSNLTVTIKGDVKHYEIIVGNLLDVSEKFTATIVTLRDRTEPRETELKLIDTLNTRNLFLSILAHDVGTPLGGIIGLSECLLMEDSDLPAERRRDIQMIHDASNQLSSLISNLLSWTRSQNGQVKCRPTPFKLHEAVTEIRQLFAEVAKTKSISLDCEIPTSIELNTDRDMLTTILRNLTSNAVKFTNENGRVTIHARVSGGEVFVSVKDNGVGIPEDQIESIFSEHKEHRRRGTKDEKGTGLGLLLCLEFVKLLGGDITVKSVENEGTDFCVRIPSTTQLS